MHSSFEEKGKIFTNVVSKKPVDVVIQTNQHTITGKIHVRPDDRLKDEVNTPETFLAVTDAVIHDLNGKLAFETSFITINRQQIIWIIPSNELKTNRP
jgi:hypothetical protein